MSEFGNGNQLKSLRWRFKYLEAASAEGEDKMKNRSSLNFVVGSSLLVVHLVNV
jgi:hypothetical protein